MLERDGFDRGRAHAPREEPDVEVVAGWLAETCAMLPGTQTALVLAVVDGELTQVAGPAADAVVAVVRAEAGAAPRCGWWSARALPGLDVRGLTWADGIVRLLCVHADLPLTAERRAVVDALAALAGEVTAWWGRAAADRRAVSELQSALDTRVIVEQAKGYLAARAHVPPEQAFVLLRQRARSTNRRLDDVAREVVAGGAAAEHLTLAAARTAGSA